MKHLLIACERSGAVREAFRRRGVDAWSCDLAPSEDGSPHHFQGDAFAALRDAPAVCGLRSAVWSLVIAHPPCTRLANSGVLRLYKNGKKINGIDLDKWAAMRAGAYFFECFFRFYAGKLVVENPIMHGHAFQLLCETVQATPRQIIQPYEFGHDASKATVLWLRRMPPLRHTKFVPPHYVCACGGPRFSYDLGKYGCPNCCGASGPARAVWANQTGSGQNKLAPGPKRAIDRARTYEGIAEAMADQWTPLL